MSGKVESTPTPAELAAEERARLALRLAAARRAAGPARAAAPSGVTADPEHRHEPFALDEIQHAYFVGRSEGVELGNVVCHSYHEIDVEDWEPARVQLAIDALVGRHEMLRAVVLPEGQQRILERVPAFPLEVVDLRGHEPARAEEQLLAIRGRLSARTQPCDRWPLLDLCLAQLDARRSRLHVSVDLLIADGRSLEIVFDELAQLVRGTGKRLPPLELSFRDYVASRTALAETEAYRRARSYWLGRLATLPAAPDLPLGRPMFEVERPACVRRTVTLDSATWTELRRRAAAADLTPSGLVMAAYAEVLAVHSRSPRFTLNLTLFNRLPLHPQANEIVGDFTTINLLEVDAGAPLSFAERAQQMRRQLWRDLDHRAFGGLEVVRELARQRGGGPRALMPVVFSSLLNLDSGDGTAWPYRLGQPVFAVTQTPQVALDCIVQQTGAGAVVVSLDAVEALFPPGLLDDLAASLARLLDDLASDPAAWQRTPRQSAERLLPAAQAEAREQANATSAPLTVELLHTPFLRQVLERPDQVAVAAPDRRLSYAELHAHATSVEEALLLRHVVPNQLVGVLLPKGCDQLVAVLGIHFAGAAYLPIDADLPPARQQLLLEHGQVRVLLTSAALRAGLTLPPGVEALAIDDLEPVLTAAPLLRRRQQPTDLAYVIYTSGSTGVPKGVMIDHRGAWNTVVDVNRRFAVGPADRVLALSRLNFDLSVYDIFGLLAAGGTVVLPDPARALDPVHWAERVRDEGVTLWNTVPALMEVFVEQLGESGAPSLRLVMMSGDWIPVTLPAQIRQACPGAQLISLGGATEASIWSILHPIGVLDPAARSVPYGRPMANQTFQVLSVAQGPCPVWVPGELHIGGIGLAQGYWRDEEKTAASFVVHPSTGERLYRTGDLGRYLPDGTIEFLGREDLQVKVNGHRIELGEIEHHLQTHAEVERAVVAVRSDAPGQRRLVGYAVLRPGATASGEDLRQHLATRLAEHMVPSTLVLLERLPLSPNGKVDRQALPAPAAEATARSTLVEPRDAVELQLLRLWEEHLGVRPIGVKDSFFDLGGTSLVAVRLFGQIHRRFGRSLPLSAMIRRPTIEHLAQLLREPGAPEIWTQLVPVRTSGSRPPLFCVHGHMGNALFYRELAARLGPDQPFYAFQARGTLGHEPHTSIEEMATAYLAELVSVQPRGPYYLGGYCFGGRVAAEMAWQLRQRGETVALVVVMALHENALEVRARMVREHLAGLSLAGRLAYLGRRLGDAVWNLGGRLKQKAWLATYRHQRARGQQLPAWMLGDLPTLNLTSAQDHSPPYQAGRVTVLLHGEVPEDYRPDPAHGWLGYRADQLEVEVVARTLDDYFKEPLVGQLASQLAAALARAGAQPTPQPSTASPQVYLAP